MNKPFEVEDRTKVPSKEEVIEQLAGIIFTDCGKGGVLFGLDADETAIAMLAAAESMLWFAKKSGIADNTKILQIREHAMKIVAQRVEMFDKSGITKLIEEVKGKHQVKLAKAEDDSDVHTEHCCVVHGCKYEVDEDDH